MKALFLDENQNFVRFSHGMKISSIDHQKPVEIENFLIWYLHIFGAVRLEIFSFFVKLL